MTKEHEHFTTSITSSIILMRGNLFQRKRERVSIISSEKGKCEFQHIFGLMCWFPRGYWQLENELYVVCADSTEYCNFHREYSNDICFDCSDLFSKSAFVNLKAKFKRVMFTLADEKQKSDKVCARNILNFPSILDCEVCGAVLIFGLSTLVGTKATKFLWPTSVADW